MKQSNNTNIRLLRQLISYNPRAFVFAILYRLLQALSPFFSLWMSAEIVNALYRDPSAPIVKMLVIVTLAGNLLLHILAAAVGRISNTENKRYQNVEKQTFLRKVLSLDYYKLEDPEIRRQRRKIVENGWIDQSGPERLRQNFLSIIDHSIEVILSLILAGELIGHMISGNEQAGSAGLLWLLAVIVLSVCMHFYNSFSAVRITKYADRLTRHMMEENRVSNGILNTNDKDVRLYNQGSYLLRIHEQSNDEHRKLCFEHRKAMFLYRIPMDTLMMFTDIAMRAMIAYYCVANVLPIGSVIKSMGCFGNLIADIQAIFVNISDIKANTPFAKEYLDFFDIPDEMPQGTLPVEKRAFCDGGDNEYEVEFRNVSFRYPGCQTYAIRNLSIRFRVGERLAVVGRNGSGKTTFIKLLCRLYDPTEGQILLNGIDIRKYDYREYLSVFSVVFQDFSLFAFPLKQNVAVSDDCDEDRIRSCLAQVGFGERLDSLPNGIDTPLYRDFDQNGVNISGGEAQKIALARALYRSAPFIILDEPTAALDPIAEADIYAKFNGIVENRTAIYISHRLSSCRFCDEIAVFEDGHIVQKGTHDSLLADAGGAYAALWQAQAQYYTKESDEA